MDMGTNANKVKITLDGNEALVDKGITILEAARQNSIHIPTLCHHPALSNWGGCRMCVVEVDGAPKLVASCVMPVREGMGVITSNDRILESRRIILEFLFAERNHNCMFCPQSGDCELQDLAYELQMDHLTVSHSFKEFPTDITNEHMGIDHNRCILCGRCVRACEEIAGNHVLSFQNRGPQALIGLDFNETREASTCYGCGVCIQVCPTGAMYNRYRTHYAVKGHVKDWQAIESFCPLCGLLCPTISSVSNNDLIKIEGKLLDDNGRPDHGQLCYKGRFEVFKSPGKRLLHPMVRKEDGSWAKENWENALDLVAKKLSNIRDEKGGEALFGLASSAVSNEALILFRELVTKGWSAGHIDTLDGAHFRTISKVWKDKGQIFKEASWKIIPEADFIMVLGANPHQSQPIISSLLRRSIQEKGTTVAVIGQIDCMPPFSAYHCPVKNGDESLLIEAILAEVIAYKKNTLQTSSQQIHEQRGKVNVPAILNKVGLNANDSRAFYEIAQTLVNAANPLLIAGPGLTGLDDPSGLSNVVNLALLMGLHPGNRLRLIILKPYGNSAGAWKLVLAPRKDSNRKDNWKGGFILLGGGEDLDGAILDGLGELDFLAVLSPYFPETLAEKAHVLMPKPLWMEEDGTYSALDGCEIAYKKKVLKAPSDIKDSWHTFSLLAERIGFHSEFKSWKDLAEEAQRRIQSNEPGKNGTCPK